MQNSDSDDRSTEENRAEGRKRPPAFGDFKDMIQDVVNSQSDSGNTYTDTEELDTYFSAEQDALDYQYMPAIDHETKLSQIAYWVHTLSAQNIAFSMTLPSAHLPLGYGKEHTHHALRLLAEEP